MDNREFNHLLQNIEKSDSKKINRPELICITRLVYYSGIIQNEIIDLRVLDVVDASGQISSVIKNRKAIKKKAKSGDLAIILPDQARRAVREYLDIMGRKNPALVKKRRSLFPSYRLGRTLRRHWQDFNTNFSEIREGGMKFHYASYDHNTMPLGKIYLEGGQIFRIWPRQYYARVADKKIRSGVDVNDEKQINVLFKELEKAERIDPNSLTVQSEATEILHKANEAFTKIKNDQTRRDYAHLVNDLTNKLAVYLPS